ncbi:MAG: site-specific integrase [Acidobacteriota bacterium]|nr:site-specific integrase [Acidobacteriota bacterium]
MAVIRKRRRARGSRWEWSVRLKGYPDRHGTCPTAECARECSRKAELELKNGVSVGRVTVAELIDLYDRQHLPTLPKSAAKYREYLVWWREQIGSHYAQSVTPQLISSCRTRLKVEPGRHGRERTNTTVNRYLNALSSVWTWALKPDVVLVSQHPVRDVERLPEPKGRVRWLTRPVDEERSEIERLLAACRESNSRILFDVVVLLLGTGCRENEIMELRRSAIRLPESGFTIRAEDAKGGEARFVPLEGAALDVVKRRLSAQPAESDWLFPGRDTGPAGFPWRGWRSALQRSGIPNFRPHDLRHTHGSYLAMLGRTLPEIMQALGHKTPTVALRYVHLSDAHKRQVAAEVNSQLQDWIER